MPKVLIVGGAGLIGYFLASELAKADIDTIVIDNISHYCKPLRPHEAHIFGKRYAEIQKMSIFEIGDASNPGFVASILEKYKPTHVVHLAGTPLLSYANRFIHDAYREIVGTTTSILACLKRTSCVQRLVYVSSSTVYGDFTSFPASEEHPLQPKGIYAGAKLACENLVRSYERQFGLDAVIVRPSAVYGPTDINRRVIQLFVENAINSRPIVVKDDNTCLDFTYVEDTARGLFLALFADTALGKTYNITRGEGRSLRELIGVLKGYFPKLDILLESADAEVPRRGSLSIAAARKDLGYEPKFPLEAGVEKYIKYIRDELNVIV